MARHLTNDLPSKVRAVIDRLRELPPTGDCPYYADIAQYMGGLPLPGPSSAHRLDGPKPSATAGSASSRPAEPTWALAGDPASASGRQVEDADRLADPPVWGGGGDDRPIGAVRGRLGRVLEVCRRPGVVLGHGQGGREVQVEHRDARQRGQVFRRARRGAVSTNAQVGAYRYQPAWAWARWMSREART